MKDRKRRALVLFKDKRAGIIEEIEGGYRFSYDEQFIKSGEAISISLPISKQVYGSSHLFPFFSAFFLKGGI